MFSRVLYISLTLLTKAWAFKLVIVENSINLMFVVRHYCCVMNYPRDILIGPLLLR
ncbi:hypothetical protein KVMX100_120381 [Klebsiella variicola]|nr:hypothetical protein KVMX100_120381 [Klebsiella variicola]